MLDWQFVLSRLLNLIKSNINFEWAQLLRDPEVWMFDWLVMVIGLSRVQFDLYNDTWVINKIRRLRSGSPICLITGVITERIKWNKVLLPINQNYKICDILGFFWIKNKKFWEVFASREKKAILSAHNGTSVQLFRRDVYCPIVLKSGQLIANHIWEFCYSYDYAW